MGVQPFTIFEAELRIYSVTSAGELDREQWIGACAETIDIEGEWEERRVQYAGDPRPHVHHEGESWKLSLSNVRAIDAGATAPRTSQIRRNQQYAIVIVWWDRDKNVWLKQTYLGAKGQPAALSGRNILQTMRFTAEERTEIAGSGSRPPFDLVRDGEVYYVAVGGERTLIYRYDGIERNFAPTAEADADLAEIDLSTADEITVTIGGEPALFADADGVQASALVSGGGSFLADEPRLEFFTGDVRCASLSAARFAAPNLLETGTAPEASAHLQFLNPGWIFSLTRARAAAPHFLETV